MKRAITRALSSSYVSTKWSDIVPFYDASAEPAFSTRMQRERTAVPSWALPVSMLAMSQIETFVTDMLSQSRQHMYFFDDAVALDCSRGPTCASSRRNDSSLY